jgi:BASS family bile acid:Na+ symporter
VTELSGSVIPLLAIAAVFTVMFALGLGLVLAELAWVRQRPWLVARALLSVLVVVPAAAVLLVRAFDLPRGLEIGVVLMGICPGAPVALQRSLGAGSHRSFAPALQILVAAGAVVSLPLSIVLLDQVYAGHAWIAPQAVARQVFIAQLLPLGLGLGIRHLAPERAAWLQPRLARLGMAMLAGVAAIIVALVSPAVMRTGLRLAGAAALITMAALASGHLLGGPEPGTRRAVAISSAARNPGLALLVATLNPGPPEVGAAIMAYLLVSAVTIVPYVYWQQRLRT